jgi:hypothetical protein
MGKSSRFLWDAITVDNTQIDLETIVAPSELEVNSSNSNLNAAVPSGLRVSLVVIFWEWCN